ncbi:MAG: hypothetical protein KU38_11820 [Sulfurovum sp. FS08-3]|nr:MAG: hypothetical protein KU38_11820 [Sulfurovum sp. FS08-3]
MATIDKEEIEKYIFDPDNPKQCKSYKLLLNIAKKENASFFSPEFLQYFYQDQILTKEFDEQIWDKPDNYRELIYNEKIKLFKDQISQSEFTERISKVNLKNNKLFHLHFIKQIVSVFETFNGLHYRSYYNYTNILDSDIENSYLYITLSQDDYIGSAEYYLSERKLNYIIFSKNYFDILQESGIEYSSIFITLENNIDKFIEQNKNSNIKPLFLKKIEDVDLLLNVLENDLKGKESQKIEQKEIARIDSIHIQNFFSIKNIELSNLHDKKEIYVVGENGDGKTLLLQAITIALAGVKEGDVFDLVKSQQEYSLVVWNTQKNEYNQNAEDAYEYILAYGASRNNYCQLKEDHTGYLSLFTSEYDLKNPIEWLQYLDYREKDEKTNIISVARAKELLNHLLNTDISIDITPDKVSFNEKGSPVSFEQLSAGYKGVITIVCDMIARFSQNQQVDNIAQFQGIVLIDEIELHLHPRWQYSFMQKLRETFPLIQFIVTTHSPTILLGASMEAVYYTIYKEEGVVKISAQKEVNNNFLNDIQSTIFGFDVNKERIHNPSKDDKRRQKRAKEGLLSLIDTIEKAQ